MTLKPLFILAITALMAGCSSQAQLALARTSVAQAHAAEARVDPSKVQSPAFDLAQSTMLQADTMLAKGERGEYGPLAKSERLNDTWMKAEIASAAFLQAGAEQEEKELRARCSLEQLQLEQEMKTLEDYRLFLSSIQKGRTEQ